MFVNIPELALPPPHRRAAQLTIIAIRPSATRTTPWTLSSCKTGLFVPWPSEMTDAVLLQEVLRLEALCKELYESQDASVRTEAEKALVAFQNSPDSLGNCCRDK